MAGSLIWRGFAFRRAYFLGCINSTMQKTSTSIVFSNPWQGIDRPISNTFRRTFSSSNTKSNNTNIEVASSEKDEVLYRAIDLLIKGHEPSVLDSFMTFMLSAADHLGIHVAGKLNPKFMADRLTLLKSIHVHKKHRVQYEIRTHRQVLQLKYLTGSTANVYLEYVERNIPAGVAMHVHKWQVERLPKHIQERMKETISMMKEEDWNEQAKFLEKMKENRLTKNSDYEEYQTTKRFLLGTVW